MVSQQTPLPFLRDIPYIFWTIDLVSFMWHNTISSWTNRSKLTRWSFWELFSQTSQFVHSIRSNQILEMLLINSRWNVWDLGGTKEGPRRDLGGTNEGPTRDQRGTKEGPRRDQGRTKEGPRSFFHVSTKYVGLYFRTISGFKFLCWPLLCACNEKRKFQNA